jgi:hypothetical protein
VSATWANLDPGLAILDDETILSSLGLKGLSEAEAREGGKALAERFSDSMPMGTLWPAETWARSCERAKGKLLVGTGPVVQPTSQGAVVQRGDEARGEGAFYLDPNDPTRLWFAFLDDAAPILWLPVEPTFAAMKAAIESMRPSDQPLSKHVRAWMGWADDLRVPNVYSGELVARRAEPDMRFTSTPRMCGTSPIGRRRTKRQRAA